MAMLNRKIEIELQSKDNGSNTFWLFYYSVTIFTAVGLFTCIIIAIYFPLNDDDDCCDNNDNEDRKGNSFAFRDVLL